jgi:hypothetical protein
MYQSCAPTPCHPRAPKSIAGSSRPPAPPSWRSAPASACTCACCCCCQPAVSRFVCWSDLYEFDLVIDINIDLYPLKVWAACRALQQQRTRWRGRPRHRRPPAAAPAARLAAASRPRPAGRLAGGASCRGSADRPHRCPLPPCPPPRRRARSSPSCWPRRSQRTAPAPVNTTRWAGCCSRACWGGGGHRECCWAGCGRHSAAAGAAGAGQREPGRCAPASAALHARPPRPAAAAHACAGAAAAPGLRHRLAMSQRHFCACARPMAHGPWPMAWQRRAP